MSICFCCSADDPHNDLDRDDDDAPVETNAGTATQKTVAKAQNRRHPDSSDNEEQRDAPSNLTQEENSNDNEAPPPPKKRATRAKSVTVDDDQVDQLEPSPVPEEDSFPPVRAGQPPAADDDRDGYARAVGGKLKKAAKDSFENAVRPPGRPANKTVAAVNALLQSSDNECVLNSSLGSPDGH